MGSRVRLQSIHMNSRQLLVIANAQAPTADPDGSHRSVVVTRTRDGFGLSLVDGGGGLDLL